MNKSEKDEYYRQIDDVGGSEFSFGCPIISCTNCRRSMMGYLFCSIRYVPFIRRVRRTGNTLDKRMTYKIYCDHYERSRVVE